jgi:phage baseplate assembly protein W
MAKAFSTEDKDLSTASIAVTRSRVYKDIDLGLALRSTGDVVKKTEAAAVKQAVNTLLNTNRFEKPFRPDFGADLQNMLFELADPETGNEIIEKIKQSFETYEPRAEVVKIEVALLQGGNAISVELQFRIKNTEEELTFETTISRLR